MSLTAWAWLAMAAYGAHILEEYWGDWRGWARSMSGLPVEWRDFWLMNAAVLVLGAALALQAARYPLLVLGYAALMLINATFAHLGATLVKRRYSPGVVTSILLFYPVGVGIYWRAAAQGALTARTLLLSLAIGAGLMAVPFVYMAAKGWRGAKRRA